MDNATPAWELPTAMRPVTLAPLVTTALLSYAHLAAATEARGGVDDANGALAADPPKRDVARAALGRATAANDDADAVAEALLLLGELDEEDGAFARALAHDRGSVHAAPDTRWALRAADRIDWLEARSEGGFAPLARLERVRRDAGQASDPDAIAALARDADAFPPGTVRVEARMLASEAWLGRLNRPDLATAELRKVVGDPNADPLTARLAERELVDALVSLGRLDEAVTEARTHADRLDPRFVRQVQNGVRRRSLRRGGIVVLAAFGGLAATAFARAQRRSGLGEAKRALRELAPVALLFVGFLALVGGALASQYESGSAQPFLLLGAAVLPLVFIARMWSAVGSARASARVGRAVLCGACVIAAAFLLLDAVSPTYLEGFGL